MNDNYMKTILSGIKEWTENLTDDAKDKANGTHKDWNENDPTQPGYIENRPFYTGDPVETVLVEESTVPFTDSNHGFYVAQIQLNFMPTVGETYKVSWDGSVYECTCVEFSGETVIGNLSIAGVGSDTGEPFVVGVMGNGKAGIYTLDTSASHTFSISGFVAEVVKIDEKYLPDDLTSKISTLSGDVSELSDDVNTLSRDVNTLSNNVSTKMDKTNPTGSGSFSLNRKANTTIGANSFAEGDKTTASGKFSHAEGDRTIASGYGSHAEGSLTTASGYASHAEGNITTALGSSSHAEGTSDYGYSAFVTVENPTDDDIITVWNTKRFSVAKGEHSHVEGENSLALGGNSHAEGCDTIASGTSSHAEGEDTTASGKYSHAEGYKTTASGQFSHAEGFGATASGTHSHAEGDKTTASGGHSHAEGERTTASGYDSHAEGYVTTASGEYSHAEGYEVIASSKYQHVQGKYNIEDSSNTYADIVGNGKNGSARSNAYTLDWEGNGRYYGTIEGRALILPSFTKGSTKKFKITVDDSGTITATEIGAES